MLFWWEFSRQLGTASSSPNWWQNGRSHAGTQVPVSYGPLLRFPRNSVNHFQQQSLLYPPPPPFFIRTSALCWYNWTTVYLWRKRRTRVTVRDKSSRMHCPTEWQISTSSIIRLVTAITTSRCNLIEIFTLEGWHVEPHKSNIFGGKVWCGWRALVCGHV